MPFNINGWELIIIGLLVVLLFGPDRLPEAAVQFGKLLREVRKAGASATAELSRELERAAEQAGTSGAEIRRAGEEARRLVREGQRAVTAVTTLEPVRGALADVAREVGDLGALAEGKADGAAAAPVAHAAPGHPAAPVAPAPRGTDAPLAREDAAIGDGSMIVAEGGPLDASASESQQGAAPEPADADPLDVEMLARRIAPFALDEGSPQGSEAG